MKKKWNISILVIFVLLASALLGVLTMNFVQQMMRSSATIYNYYQSYYIAKWGLEFGLAELTHRGIGFQQTLNSWNALFSWNFLCKWRCGMRSDLLWTSPLLSNDIQAQTGCQSPYILSWHSSLLVPLFEDVTTWSYATLFSSNIQYKNLYSAVDNLQVHAALDGDVVFGMLILSWEDLFSEGIFFRTWNLQNDLQSFISSFESRLQSLNIPGLTALTNDDISPYRFYFMISNPIENTAVSFCLSSQEPLPPQQYYLKSRGKYDDQVLGLDALYKQPIPDFLLNAYTDY